MKESGGKCARHCRNARTIRRGEEECRDASAEVKLANNADASFVASVAIEPRPSRSRRETQIARKDGVERPGGTHDERRPIGTNRRHRDLATTDRLQPSAWTCRQTHADYCGGATQPHVGHLRSDSSVCHSRTAALSWLSRSVTCRLSVVAERCRTMKSTWRSCIGLPCLSEQASQYQRTESGVSAARNLCSTTRPIELGCRRGECGMPATRSARFSDVATRRRGSGTCCDGER